MEKSIQTTETTAVVAGQQSNLQLAIEKGMPPETIAKMMDLEERWQANMARRAFVDAMAGFKRECPAVIGKDRRADFGTGKAKYSYATTGAIVTAITPALSKFGLSLSWETQQKDKTVTVTCHVTHAGGHRESATLTGPHDESGGKNPIQTLGSSVHYLQRYTLVSVLGLATAEMDDPDSNPSRPPVAMPTPRATAPASAPTPPEKAPDTPFSGNSEAQLDNVVCGKIEAEAKPKTGTKKDGSTWTKFGFKLDGVWYGTFSETLAATIREMKAEDIPVALTWQADGEYRTAVDIRQAAGVELP